MVAIDGLPPLRAEQLQAKIEGLRGDEGRRYGDSNVAAKESGGSRESESGRRAAPREPLAPSQVRWQRNT